MKNRRLLLCRKHFTYNAYVKVSEQINLFHQRTSSNRKALIFHVLR